MARVVKHHLVGGFLLERRPAFHRLQDATFAFDAQRLCRDALPFRNPARTGTRIDGCSDYPARCALAALLAAHFDGVW